MKSRKINPELKISQVVAVARRLFVEKGYHNVTIPQIVAASGVSTGSIYKHFTNKEGLARYIHEETISDFQRQLNDRLAGAETTYQKLRCFSELIFDITEKDPEMMEYMLSMRHTEFLPESHPICSTEPFIRIQQIVANGIESGELRSADYLVAATSYSGVILRAAELRMQGVIKKPLQDCQDDLIKNAWAAIKAS